MADTYFKFDETINAQIKKTKTKTEKLNKS